MGNLIQRKLSHIYIDHSITVKIDINVMFKATRSVLILMAKCLLFFLCHSHHSSVVLMYIRKNKMVKRWFWHLICAHVWNMIKAREQAHIWGPYFHSLAPKYQSVGVVFLKAGCIWLMYQIEDGCITLTSHIERSKHVWELENCFNVDCES